MGIEYSDIAIMVIALAIGGFVKGVTGLGLPSIAIPVMAGFLGVEHAVIIMVIPIAVLNAWLVWTHRGQALEVKELPKLLIWGCLGALWGRRIVELWSKRKWQPSTHRPAAGSGQDRHMNRERESPPQPSFDPGHHQERE